MKNTFYVYETEGGKLVKVKNRLAEDTMHLTDSKTLREHIKNNSFEWNLAEEYGLSDGLFYPNILFGNKIMLFSNDMANFNK